MVLGPRLDLRQSQQLVMTPQLQQAIKLLTLTNVELEAFIETEVEKNPLLEMGDIDGGGEPMEAASGEDGPIADAFVSTDSAFSDDRPMAAQDSPLDVDMGESVFHHNGAGDGDTMREGGGPLDGLSVSGAGAASGGTSFDDLPGLDATLAEDLSLHDHLLGQAGVAFSDPADLFIARYLIDLVSETGYLPQDLGEAVHRLGVLEDDVLRVLATLQTFEPTGVCARSLAECLMLQAREADRFDPAMETLLNNLELLARGDIPALKRLCAVDNEDMADMIRELRAYNPKPGLAYGGERVQTVVPDIFVRKSPTGSWQVELNSATLPRVLVNRTYYAELNTKNASKAEKQFLTDQLASANWLLKALDQRARTILKVATELVRRQEEFFEHGVRYLRPLNLRVIAEAISMHESTVSRVTSNKYMSTNRGVFELKFFFSSAIQGADGGDALAGEAVKSRIRDLIDAESPNNILSDDDLVKLLVSESVDIARRTVAKYREAMHIPSSVQRRRLKAVAKSKVMA
jgi:RNA polymerase sigma-54 factor